MSNGLFFKASLPSLVSTSECCPVIKLPRESIKILVTILHDNILEGDLFSHDIAYNLWIYTQQNVNILNRVSNIIKFERVPGSKCQMAPPQGQKFMRLKKYAKNIFSMLNKMLVVHSFRHMHNAYKESPRGSASGMSRCHFFGWLLMSLLSLFLVQMG